MRVYTIAFIITIWVLFILSVIILPFTYSWNAGCTEYNCTFVPSQRFDGDCFDVIINNQTKTQPCTMCPWQFPDMQNGTCYYQFNTYSCPVMSYCRNNGRWMFYTFYSCSGFILLTLISAVSYVFRSNRQDESPLRRRLISTI